MAKGKGGKKRRALITGFGAVLIFVLAFAILFYFNFRTVEVRGPSMEPTLKQGRRLLVSNAYWLVGPIRQRDIVVAHPEGMDDVIIKRVAGLAGDKMRVDDSPNNYSITSGEPYVVPAGTLFLIGDNRPMSSDSREFGPVQEKDIIGKVIVFAW
jgi:signal peptidase I